MSDILSKLKDVILEGKFVALVVKLWIAFVLASFLIPDSNMCIQKWILQYIDNLEELGKYNWGEYVHSITMEKIDSCHKRVMNKRPRSKKDGAYMNGCAFSLLVR